jgi:hypothetical protein
MGTWSQEVRTALTGSNVWRQQLEAIDRLLQRRPTCAVQKVVTGPDEDVASSIHQER